MISGGYIITPRAVQDSDIAVAPPYVREIWQFLLREANSQDNRYAGHELKRGQLFRSYDDVREGLKWFIGWRKMTYSENQTKKAMKFLRETGRIITTKELGGVLITICKYDYYQNPANYERTTREPNERTIAEPLRNQPLPDNNKNKRNLRTKEGKKINIDPLFFSHWEKWLSYRSEIKKPYRSLQTSQQKYDHLVELSGGDPDLAGKIIDQSIREGWTGFFPLKSPITAPPAVGNRTYKDLYNKLLPS